MQGTEAGVSQFILKNWIMLDLKLVTEVNENICMLKHKYRCKLFPGLVPWYQQHMKMYNCNSTDFFLIFIFYFSVIRCEKKCTHLQKIDFSMQIG